MTSGHSSNKVPFQWYNAAWTLDQNWVTNEAFQSSYCVPTSNPISTQTHPPIPNIACPSVNAHFHLSPRNIVPINVNAAQWKTALLITCYHCGKARHKALDCDLHFDICTCTVNELQGFFMIFRLHGSHSACHSLGLDFASSLWSRVSVNSTSHLNHHHHHHHHHHHLTISIHPNTTTITSMHPQLT